MGNVEEESQISAFNQLLLSEVRKVNKSMEELQEFYLKERKKYL
jgi:hypothetical protein